MSCGVVMLDRTCFVSLTRRLCVYVCVCLLLLLYVRVCTCQQHRCIFVSFIRRRIATRLCAACAGCIVGMSRCRRDRCVATCASGQVHGQRCVRHALSRSADCGPRLGLGRWLGLVVSHSISGECRHGDRRGVSYAMRRIAASRADGTCRSVEESSDASTIVACERMCPFARPDAGHRRPTQIQRGHCLGGAAGA